jgi:hypothetical protein
MCFRLHCCFTFLFRLFCICQMFDKMKDGPVLCPSAKQIVWPSALVRSGRSECALSFRSGWVVCRGEKWVALYSTFPPSLPGSGRPLFDPSDDLSAFGKEFALDIRKGLVSLRNDVDRERVVRGPTEYSQMYFNVYIHIMATISSPLLVCYISLHGEVSMLLYTSGWKVLFEMDVLQNAEIYAWGSVLQAGSLRVRIQLRPLDISSLT